MSIEVKEITQPQERSFRLRFSISQHMRGTTPVQVITETELRELVEKGAIALGDMHEWKGCWRAENVKLSAENTRLRRALEKIRGNEKQPWGYCYLADRALAGEEI